MNRGQAYEHAGAGLAVVISTGEALELRPGWNAAPSGVGVYLRKDGTWVETAGASTDWTAARDGKAMVGGSRAQDPGPARQPLTVADLPTKHGAWSARRVDPLVEQLVQVAVGAVQWLAEESFRPALLAWARAEVRAELITAWLDEHGPLDGDGQPRPALAAVTQQETLAMKHRQRLGLDPASRAQLEATLTGARASQASLEAALARGAEALRARRAPTGPAGAPQGSPGDEGQQPPAPGDRGSPGPTDEERP